MSQPQTDLYFSENWTIVYVVTNVFLDKDYAMNVIIKIIVVSIAVLCLPFSSVNAFGPGSGFGGGGPGGWEGSSSSGGMSPYRKDSFVTKEGVISKIEDSSFNPVMKEKGLHLKVKTSSGTYTVHVAPQWYIDQEQIAFRKGDEIVVSGSEFFASRGWITGKNIYAATIQAPTLDEPLQVRDPNTGEGLWFGRNQGESDMTDEERDEFRTNMRERMMQQMRGRRGRW